MWTFDGQYAQKSRFKQCGKRHGVELNACLKNLGRLVEALNGGLTLQQCCAFGFFRSEGKDVYRIAQTGVRSAHETRLYVYARITGSTICILTVGDKNTQQDDIRWCHSTADEIRRTDHECARK